MSTGQKTVDIAVSIINYRTGAMTLDCVRSVLAAAAEETGLRIDTVVIDNDSGDGSAEMIADWIEEQGVQDRVRLLRSATNSGFSGGHNQGIAATDSAFVLILNSDAALRPGFFGPLMAAARAHPEAGFFSPRLEEPDGTPQVGGFRFHSPFSELIRAAVSGPVTRLLQNHVVPLGPDPDPSQVGWVSFACVLLRRSMITAIGPMDEGFFLYFEDCEYSLRAARAGYGAILVPQARVVHIRGGSGPVTMLQGAGKRLPEYFYLSRSRYFYLAHGRAGLLAANLCWHLGRAIAALRPLTGRRIPSAAAHEARDIWTGFLSPLARSGRPGT